MTLKTYTSNLAKAWSATRQEALFARHVPGWPNVAQYADEPSAAKRKSLAVDSLVHRGDLLRATRKRDVAYVASLACLAMHEADLAGFLLAFGARGGAAIVLDIDLTIPAGAMTPEAHAAIAAFRKTKRGTQTEPGRLSGAKVAAERREAEARAKAEPFRDRWNRKDDRTLDLLAEMDLSYNTASKYLGKRPEAQAAFDAGQQQAERNRKRRKHLA